MSDTRSKKDTNWYWSDRAVVEVKEKSTTNKKNTKTVDVKVKNQELAPVPEKRNNTNARNKSKNQEPAPVAAKRNNRNTSNKAKNQQSTSVSVNNNGLVKSKSNKENTVSN